jgi:predicted DCC family thiol-disulfide oxidoreductase YuxK
MSVESSSASDPCVLIYDGQCRLCVSSKRGLERVSASDPSRSVRFVPYQSEEARRLLGAEYRPERPDVAFLIDANGTIRRGLDAFLPLLPGLPGGRLLSALVRLPALRWIANRLYKQIARHRYHWFGTAR